LHTLVEKVETEVFNGMLKMYYCHKIYIVVKGGFYLIFIQFGKFISDFIYDSEWK